MVETGHVTPVLTSDWSSRGKCLVMENLTQGLLKPSVMDLKMGTSMYSDLAPETKMLSQRRKSSRTTSSSLGLRWARIGGGWSRDPGAQL